MANPEADHGGVMSREQQEAVSRAVAVIMENRAVINQASGILMMVDDTDAEAAFAVLKKRSQDTNTKLRALAAQLLSDVRKLDYRAQPPTHASLDHLLLRLTNVCQRTPSTQPDVDRRGRVLRSFEGVAACPRRRNGALAKVVIMANHSADRSAEQAKQGAPVVSSGRAHALDDGPVDRPSGAIEDGIVSSTADPAEGREFGGGKTVPPGDAKPVLPPYDRRKESTAGGTPGRGDNEVAGTPA